MKSKEFLVKELTEISYRFENVQIRYEHRKNTFSHIVEIIPLVVFNNNEEYMNAEAYLEDEFERLFPQENIVFISEDSLTEIKNPDYLFGYKSVVFENPVFDTELIIEGFSQRIDFSVVNYYVLAA